MRVYQGVGKACLGLLFLYGCSRKPADVPAGLSLPSGDAQAGRVVFEKTRCYSCHEVAGQSFPKPSLESSVRLTQEHAAKPAEEIARSIIHPSHTISGFPSAVAEGGERSKMGDLNRVLSVQDVADLVAFVRTIQGL
jgi:mono/diheme cytochrome c family protein